MEKQKFTLAEDAIDPAQVPHRTLYTGAKIPAVGLGTFGSDRFSGEAIAQAVKGAVAVGYRHIDCAAVYGNEHLIGQTFREVLSSGLVKREALWVTSKLWNDKHAEEDVIPTCQKTLDDLQLDYLDMYLIHWPFPNHHDPGVDVNARDPHAVPYIHENYMKTWQQMEKLVDMGLARHIGTSNMSRAKLELLLRDARIRPAANEMELHPHFQQPELYQYCLDNNIIPIGFSPIGSPSRPERDTTPEDTVDIEDPVIVKAAARLGVHPAVVCIKWAVQRGQVPIPFAIKRDQYLSNLRAAVVDPLTDEEMAEIAAIDKNCRLIKGQVFLWEGAKSWEDLWDLDGTIAS
ncbi:MAG: aldo/keto reductase [Anaerolineaceae bacterium]|nr:aldo/keto reductase [Anaerolineaceae bacterium]